MAEKSEKSLSFDKFKERVYKNIGTLESLDEATGLDVRLAENTGCFGFFIGGLGRFANKKAREHMKLSELTAKADEILSRPDVKDFACAELDATVNLPIDVAYKITPVLYDLALKEEENFPVDSMLFAIICRKIAVEGVEKFCGQPATQAEKDKTKKARSKKPASD